MFCKPNLILIIILLPILWKFGFFLDQYALLSALQMDILYTFNCFAYGAIQYEKKEGKQIATAKKLIVCFDLRLKTLA